MSEKNIRNQMGDIHEEHILHVFGGRRTRGSGNQWRDQTDVRMSDHDEAVAFAFDGKSTLAKSASVSRADLDKLTEQAAELRPCLALRFYANGRLRDTEAEDWYVLREQELLELIERSRTLHRIERFLREASPDLTAKEIASGLIEALEST